MTRVTSLRMVVLGAAIVLLGQIGAPGLAAERGSSSYDEEIQKGETSLRRAEFQQALNAFKRAADLRPTSEALFGIARAYDGLDSHKLAIEFCGQALGRSHGDPALEAEIRDLRGGLLMSDAQGPDDPRLRDAEADLRAAAASIVAARFNLGVSLLKQNRDADGIRELQLYLEELGDTRDGDVRRIIENPRRAREPYAPEFTLKDVQGQRRTLSDLSGKVVVLDFWGSWCLPCVKAVPGLASLAKKLEGRAVLISIDEGDSETAWRRFVAKNDMGWPQCWDSGRYAHIYNVRAYPTYVIIDGEGLIRARRSGYGGRQTEAWLEAEIQKAARSLSKNGR